MQQTFGVFGVVGDLGSEVVALTEHLPCGGDDLFGVVVVLGEDQRLRNNGTIREDLGEEPVPERFEHAPDLCLAGHVTVELGGLVFEVFVEFFETLLTGAAVLFGNGCSSLDRRPLLRNLGFDPEHLEVDVHAVSDRLGVGVFRHQVLLEEPVGLFGGGGGQAEDVSVEVLQHAPPHARRSTDGTRQR